MKQPQSPLLTARAFYFFYYAAWACLSPFLVLYYRSLGFNGAQIGILTAISPLTSLFAAPFWGGMADATHRHKHILFTAVVGAIASAILLSQVQILWVMIPVVAAFAFFAAPIIPLTDNSVIALLGSRREDYGKQRLWGAVGWGLSGPVAGLFVQNYGISMSFAGYVTLGIFLALTALRLTVIPTTRAAPFWVGMNRLLTNRRWFLFLVVAYLSGSGLAVISNYLFLYMADLNASSTVMGLSLTVATISELPALFFSGHLLRRWGPRGVLIISLVAYVLRMAGYAAATAPWQALLLQLFHGLSFSAMWVAGVNFANEIAPPGLGATAQGLFGSTVMGLGGITGAFAGGLLFDHLGGHAMFAVSGLVVFAGLVLFIFTGKSLKSASS